MKTNGLNRFYLLLSALFFLSISCSNTDIDKERISYVDCMIGTGGFAYLLPVASAPFGMVQLGPDHYLNACGYKYEANEIIGFSHTHMSGCGCNEFKDIMFFPVSDESLKGIAQYPQRVAGKFSHEQERAEPGYYKVILLDSEINAELTATARCGMHRYTFPEGKAQQLIIDLKHGHNTGCTVCQENNFDTVRVAHIEIVNNHTIRGYRISDGWLKGVHVYFYAEFSKPFTHAQLYNNKELMRGTMKSTGLDVRAIMQFSEADNVPLIIRTGISPVSMDGAYNNLQNEIRTWDFDRIKKNTQQLWETELSKIKITDENTDNKVKFYTFLYRTLFYPMLYSDVTGEYRGSDNGIHYADFNYFAGSLSLWDTFRAQNPLMSILRPDVANELMKTLLKHYENCGQLPQWTGAGIENLTMIGYPAMPIIADLYYKGIRDYNFQALYDAMKVSANLDTFGYSGGNCLYKGTYLYKKNEYVPCDMDINSVSKSLEFNYGDWCIAQMARMMGMKDDYDFYINRASWYKKLYDPGTKLLRPKNAKGEWKIPFDPVFTSHYHNGDDYCEGTAYQWTFFVPHDTWGLAKMMGGNEIFSSQLDSLFIRSSEIHDGGKGSPDLNPQGMIGQYAHSNEPCHHIIYLYNSIGQPWKTQKMISIVMQDLYKNTPDGICGNDDTGQMSAWYVFSAMGFYPVTHGDGVYYIGTPLFKDVCLKHSRGVLQIKANNVSDQNVYIQSLTIDGKPYTKNWFRHEDIFGKNTTLVFEMGNKPEKKWGSASDAFPPSMISEKF